MSAGRGRLLRPVMLEIERIDVTATRSAGGYDDALSQPIVTPASAPGVAPNKGAPRGVEATAYMLPVRVPAQVEVGLRGLSTNGLMMVQTGNQPKFRIDATMHFEDLEAEGLIDIDGHPAFRTGDRLTKILHKITGDLIETTPDAYVVQLDSKSFGLGAADRNLLVVAFESRAKGAMSA